MLNSENAELKTVNQNLKIINSDISMKILQKMKTSLNLLLG